MQILQDAPATPPAKPKHLWDSEQGRIMAQKSVAVRRENAERLENLMAGLPLAEPPDPRLELVQEQIARTRAELNERKPYCKHCDRGGMEPHHRAQLLRALDVLLDRERIIMGKGLPASYKPMRAKARSGPSELRPSEPDTPTGGSQTA